MNKNIKITNQLENMNTAGQVELGVTELHLEELEQVNGGEPPRLGVQFGEDGAPHCPYCGEKMMAVPLVGPHSNPASCGKSRCVMAALRADYERRRQEGIEAARNIGGKVAVAAGMGAAVGGPVAPILGAVAAAAGGVAEFADMMPHPELCNVC
jgi:uncharacterized Zn-finger protein